jgi:poly-gamma-glutamate capsule biosynthesis protein CapA/YwtB (metallophosphatase superfamily)
MRRSRFFAVLTLLALSRGAASAQGPEILRLSFLGDIMAHLANYRMQDFHDIYDGVADLLKEDDLTFANLEFPVDPLRPVAGYPLFNGRREYWKAAVDSGVEVFSLANNHAFDQGSQGIFQTLRSAVAVQQSSGRAIWVSGVRGNPARPYAPAEISVKGYRVGYIAATQFINQGASCPYINIVDYRDGAAADRFASFVASESGRYDLFIVSYHCGVEYSSAPSPELLAFFRRLLESGAEIVHGHHPHVFQQWRVERVNGADRVILPSMGNFISAMTWGMNPADPNNAYAVTGDSAVVRVDFLRVGDRVRAIRWDAVPISNYMNSGGEMVVGKLRGLAAGTPFLSEAWTKYYLARLQALEGLLPPLVSGDQPARE